MLLSVLFLYLIFDLSICDPPKVWFGFYDDYSVESTAAGANVFIASDIKNVPLAYSKGLRSIMSVIGVVNTSSVPYQLYPNWNQMWTDLASQISPFLKNGSIVGIFLGDELVWNCLPTDDFQLFSKTVRDSFPNTIIWSNEAYQTIEKGNTKCGAKVKYELPSEVSWLSTDRYHTNGPRKFFVDLHVKLWYDLHLFPKLKNGQKAAVVPGSFSSTYNDKCDQDCYEEMCSEDAQNYVDWALKDDRVDAIFPWHWKSCSTSPDCINAKDEIGTAELPDLTSKWLELSKKLL